MNQDPKDNKSLSNTNTITELSELIKLNTNIAAKQAKFKKELENIVHDTNSGRINLGSNFLKKSSSLQQDINLLFRNTKAASGDLDLINSIAAYQRQLSHFSKKLKNLSSGNNAGVFKLEFNTVIKQQNSRMIKQQKSISEMISKMIKSEK